MAIWMDAPIGRQTATDDYRAELKFMEFYAEASSGALFNWF